ncbi:N-acetylglucosaminylphosphotransferase [Lachnospiraceae bacterium TWA4]|nr:N-acetylglucosaminylphosphotransferase [Lachnospiraceae bacterium TWA4]
MKNNLDIDFVIIWVDGNDLEWQKEKNKYLGLEDSDVDASIERYRDWDNLRYWFRAVEQYAPWVRKIHFVTCGHIPSWLNTDASKLHLVKHSDYIPQKYLPVFSSHPIELNLHRIEGLSEHFVFFNDDFFLNAPVKPTDFFVKGMPCDSLAEMPIDFAVRKQYNHIMVNDVIFASEHFNRMKVRKMYRNKWYNVHSLKDSIRNLMFSVLKKEAFFGFDIHHLPMAYRKKTFEEVWDVDPSLLDRTCSHRFRDDEDVSQCVFKFWQLLTGQFYPYNKRRSGKLYPVGRYTSEVCDAIRTKKYKMICINDTDVENFEETKNQINSVFEEVLSNKSSFEL